jgi:hypothetical protein
MQHQSNSLKTHAAQAQAAPVFDGLRMASQFKSPPQKPEASA